MITNLQSGMTLFMKPSEHCRAQMYSLSTQFLKTWCLVTAKRIANESEAARISAKVHAKAAMIAALNPLGLPRKLRPLGLPRKLRPLGLPRKLRNKLGSPLGSPLYYPDATSPLPLAVLLSSHINARRRRDNGSSFGCVCSLNIPSLTFRGIRPMGLRRPMSLRLLKSYPQKSPSY